MISAREMSGIPQGSIVDSRLHGQYLVIWYPDPTYIHNLITCTNQVQSKIAVLALKIISVHASVWFAMRFSRIALYYAHALVILQQAVWRKSIRARSNVSKLGVTAAVSGSLIYNMRDSALIKIRSVIQSGKQAVYNTTTMRPCLETCMQFEPQVSYVSTSSPFDTSKSPTGV